MRRVTAPALLAALAACSNPGASGDANSTSLFGSSFDNGFRTQFRAKFIEQCAAGARSTSHSNADFSGICGCTADKLLTTQNVSQLMTGPSDTQIRGAAAQCAREHPLR